MKGSLSIGRIAGITISVHYTWFFIVILISWSLAQGLFPSIYPGWSTTEYWVTSIIAAILLFVSVLIHELAHSIVARSKNIPVNNITLFLFGGVSNLEKEPETSGAEFIMALVGPLSSLILAFIFLGIQIVISPGSNVLAFFLGQPAIGATNSPIVALLNYLGWINFLLALFNLIPGFPLDGGRVLRAIIWGATGNFQRATNIAATIGQIFAWIFIGFGILQIFSGNFVNGIWIAFIGWFLNSAAESSRQEMTFQQHFRGVKVQTVMKSNPEIIKPTLTVSNLIQDIFLHGGHRAAAVSQDDQFLGIVTLTDVKKLNQQNWDTTTVETIMTKQPIYSVKPDDDLKTALTLIAQHGLNQIPVLQDKKIVGMLSRADIIRYIQISQELGTSNDAK